jgi:hypothetical protein
MSSIGHSPITAQLREISACNLNTIIHLQWVMIPSTSGISEIMIGIEQTSFIGGLNWAMNRINFTFQDTLKE